MPGAGLAKATHKNPNCKEIVFIGGIFLDNTISSSILDAISSKTTHSDDPHFSISYQKKKPLFKFPAVKGGDFLCVGLSIRSKNGLVENSNQFLWFNGVERSCKEEALVEPNGVGDIEDEGNKQKVQLRDSGRGAVNTTKHLWAGAVAAMVSRTFVAPLERLKLEYMVRGEEKKLFELIKTIAATQGLRGFWKGNLVNILRTAPFKAVNFYAYDTYRKQLLKLHGNEETTNFERLIAGAAAGITATVLCLPLDTIRTKLVAPGGEALGGVIGAFRHVIQTEGFFSLYKGLLPSIMSIAPSAAVFYGVYDILKSAYLHSAEGRKRIQNMKRQGQELNALDQLELGPIRTLLHGAISGACAEAATYPFEVVRRQLQLQGRYNKGGVLTTSIKIVEHGGVPALYAGLVPSLLQVLPSAAISYFVYEFVKIILKVE
ncbi:probable mitochondrial adenine nucleotide transporter BTL3 isoform X1 [Coffea arabica]|uniref:Probable mitochondrial adenine nucleotide transporter BTL3 isoform X1 n=1 Tax=Coffea arabica TaxID=13443 RepID=A0A6P6UJW2_COFAR|nr:probable mitochondrial adenine nucleotide transporter BTL3 isoform X1 [Coffea arabica]XP_027090591.1 probable mitochondrial adenine nucleotide transporter BTL3 isoform X1 [Coffea arabica]